MSSQILRKPEWPHSNNVVHFYFYPAVVVQSPRFQLKVTFYRHAVTVGDVGPVTILLWEQQMRGLYNISSITK